MGGSVKMVDETLKLAYGNNSEFIKDKRIAAVQSLSRTGACRLFADFQKRFRPGSEIYIPVPTWSNHHNIWRDAQVPQKTYHYYHPETKGLNFSGLMDDEEVKIMADRIIGMRTTLRESLEKLGSPLSWEHVTKQIGMFCYSGLTPEQVDRLTSEYHIYMTRNGRISMAGVTTGNVGYLANAIHEVTKSS